jgi:hypothetical protein
MICNCVRRPRFVIIDLSYSHSLCLYLKSHVTLLFLTFFHLIVISISIDNLNHGKQSFQWYLLDTLIGNNGVWKVSFSPINLLLQSQCLILNFLIRYIFSRLFHPTAPGSRPARAWWPRRTGTRCSRTGLVIGSELKKKQFQVVKYLLKEKCRELKCLNKPSRKNQNYLDFFA